MKRIVYVRAADGRVCIVNPCEGARLALQVIAADGSVLKPHGAVQAPADTFLRRWPAEGAQAVWAETEDEFVGRVVRMAVPADALDVRVIEEHAIPIDRSRRDEWRLGVDGIEVPEAVNQP